MKIKLHRDEARTIQRNFFPYMESIVDENCERYRNNKSSYLGARLVRNLFCIIRLKFEKKLTGFAERFTVTLYECEAITLYQLMLSFPVDSKEVWMVRIRSIVIEAIDKQLAMPEITPGQTW